MGEVEVWRPVTPSQTLDAPSYVSPIRDYYFSPSQKMPTISFYDSFEDNLSPLSPQTSSLSRSQSKTSLRSFLSRGRSASVTSQRPDTSISHGRPATASGNHSRHSSGTVARAESPHLSKIGFRLDGYRPTQVTHAAHIDRARSQQQKTRRWTSPAWDPPPLFQAYPQSLKHAILDASCLSTDVILRKSSYRDARSPDDPAKAEPVDTQSVGAILKRAKEGSNKHARKLSASINSSGWTTHIFVLLDSGYLIQYAGSGPDDRLPEKMMQLQRDTVAFASDAIPGRHWVLQVSQAAGEDAVMVPERSKGIWARIGLHSAETRRTAHNFLMVFDNAEDLDSWLTTIRRRVEVLRSRQHRSQTPANMEAGYPLSDRPIQIISAQGDPHQFPSRKVTPHHQALSPVESEFPENDRGLVDDQMFEFRFWDTETTSQRTSADSSTITSTDLDPLRNSKDSSSSTDTSTSTAFLGHSPSSSSGCDPYALKSIPSFESVDTSTAVDPQLEDTEMRDHTLVEPHSPTFLCHALDAIDVDGDIQTENVVGPSNVRKPTKFAPNFSVPISSNRFSFFGSSETLNPNTGRDTRSTSLPSLVEDSFIDNSPEDDSFSGRPLSTIAPLPTPEALMNPTGTRTWTPRRPLVDKPLPLQPFPVVESASAGLADRDYKFSYQHAPKIPAALSSPEDQMFILSAPLLPPTNESPPLPRSNSYHGLSTFYHCGAASTQSILFPPPLQGQRQQRPPSFSVFPEPPCNVQPVASSPGDIEAPEPSLAVKALARSIMASLGPVTITEAPTGVNSRLSRIRDSRGVRNLGVIPPSGPPPSCPLPDTPSPRRRRFRPLSKSNTCWGQNRSDIVPPLRRSSTKVATEED
jgi:hypothetical protein